MGPAFPLPVSVSVSVGVPCADSPLAIIADAASQLGRPSALIIPCATSTLKPWRQQTNQKRRTSSNISRTSAFSQLKPGCEESKRCRYHCPHDPSDSRSRVHAGPPKTLFQSLGGWVPSSPLPSRI